MTTGAAGLRVGIVGTGAMGATHLRSWRAADVHPVGVTASTAASAHAFGERHRVRPFASFEALLEACDVVDLCVPTDLHAPLTIRAAEAGTHVVCEKPIALTVEGGRAMIDACERHGVRLYVAHVLRFFPVYREARKLILDGAIGEVRRVHLERASSVPEAGWFRDPKRSGGLALDLMVHDVDWALWTFSRPSSAQWERTPEERPKSAERRRLRLAWSAGIEGIVEGSWNDPSARTGFVAEGNGGRLVGGTRLFLEARTAGATKRELVPLPGIDPYEAQARHLANAFASNDPFSAEPSDALKAVQLLTE